MENQTRTLSETVHVRAEDGGNFIDFYASVFNRRSKLLSEEGKVFYEIILPGAFNDALDRDDLNVLAVLDHEKKYMLARTRSGTLNLNSDEKGLKASFKMPDTSLGRDALEMIIRGDIDESSFKFSVLEKDAEYKREGGVLIRYVKRINRLMDVSLIRGDGAYAGTDIYVRGFEEFEQSELQEQAERNKKELDKYYINLKSRIND